MGGSDKESPHHPVHPVSPAPMRLTRAPISRKRVQSQLPPNVICDSLILGGSSCENLDSPISRETIEVIFYIFHPISCACSLVAVVVKAAGVSSG